MSTLAGLVERQLMASDWAQALAPVEDRVTAMGRFLREELAAGRSYLPDGATCCGRSSGRSPTCGC